VRNERNPGKRNNRENPSAKKPGLKTIMVADEKHFAPTELGFSWAVSFYKDFATLSLKMKGCNKKEKAP